jgi:hypothetical protein
VAKDSTRLRCAECGDVDCPHVLKTLDRIRETLLRKQQRMASEIEELRQAINTLPAIEKHTT